MNAYSGDDQKDDLQVDEEVNRDKTGEADEMNFCKLIPEMR